ncbi:MAG TPA: oligosaccharide flippase family protein [Chloroflexia bacterium]|nr:oligosaccharide flippase family protein [Chloroflexia bacterium]
MLNFIKHNKLLAATFFVSLAAFLSLFLTSLAGLYIVRELSKDAYGRMTYFSTWLPPMLLILGLGLTSKIIKDVVDARSIEDKTGVGVRLYTLLSLRFLTVLPLPLLGFVLWGLLGQFPYLLITLIAFFSISGDFLLGILRGNDKLYICGALMLLQPVVYIILLLSGLAQTVEGVFSALCLSYISNLVVEALLVINIPGLLPSPKGHLFSITYARQALKFSSNIYLNGLYQTLFNSWLLIILGFLNLYETVAELSIPLTLVALPMLVNSPILVTIVYPRLVQSRQVALNTFNTAYRVVAIVTIPAAAVMAVFPDTVIELLYTGRYLTAAPLLVVSAPLVFVLAMESLLTLTQIGLEQFRSAMQVQFIRLSLLIVGTGLILLSGANRADYDAWLTIVFLIAALTGLWYQIGHLRKAGSVSIASLKMLQSGIASVIIALLLREVILPVDILWINLSKAVIAGLLGVAVSYIIYFGRNYHPWIQSDNLAFQQVAEQLPQFMEAKGERRR